MSHVTLHTLLSHDHSTTAIGGYVTIVRWENIPQQCGMQRYTAFNNLTGEILGQAPTHNLLVHLIDPMYEFVS